MIQSVQSGYPSQAVEPITPGTRGVQASAPSARSGDSVNLSDASQLMASFFAGLGIDCTPGEPLTLDDMEQGLERSREKLESDVGAMFLQHGISTTPPVELTTDGEGNVRVAGDHPQKEEIEALFAGRPELANDFRKVSSLSSMVDAAQEYLEFAKAYAEDPYAAVRQYAHLFNGMDMGDEPFSLVIGGEEEQAAEA